MRRYRRWKRRLLRIIIYYVRRPWSDFEIGGVLCSSKQRPFFFHFRCCQSMTPVILKVCVCVPWDPDLALNAKDEKALGYDNQTGIATTDCTAFVRRSASVGLSVGLPARRMDTMTVAPPQMMEPCKLGWLSSWLASCHQQHNTVLFFLCLSLSLSLFLC